MGETGLVYLYTARDSETTAMSMKQKVAPLKDVLSDLAAVYSPIKSKCIHY
jgi:hypothetical protein